MTEQVLTSLISSSPLAAALFFIWWNERKERIDTQQRYEKFLGENADKLLHFAEVQRNAIHEHTTAIKAILDDRKQ